MSETKTVTFTATEENIQKILVDAFKETKNVGWLIELLLCYDDNVKLLEGMGLNIDDIKSFTSVKKTGKNAKVTKTGIKLFRKKQVTDADLQRIENLVNSIRQNYVTQS